MKYALVSCALIAGVVAAGIPSPMQGKHFLSVQQQLTEQSPLQALKLASTQREDADESTSAIQGLTCEQIRIMDEVEFITDDSYCTERS